MEEVAKIFHMMKHSFYAEQNQSTISLGTELALQNSHFQNFDLYILNW